MNDYKLIADLLLPDITTTPEYYEALYPDRNLAPDAMVTRFAPSPTGFLHLGSLYAALVAERLAHQSGGIFYLRVEDTDKKREVEGATEQTVKALQLYAINFDEGLVDGIHEKGVYGPYMQSSRETIYKTYIKSLLIKGLAYPCFCTHEELEEIKKEQESQKVNTGYHGKWAKCRDMSLEDVKNNLESEKNYVIRLKSPGDPEKKVVLKDLIKGTIEMPENNQDIVILKSDGLPTYHFAHVIDDYLMKTTHVTRGEEWLSSVPIHLQLFDILGFKVPHFAHISTIMKMDGNSKRKLSKRKDPEISFNFYNEQGYPSNSVIEYLLNLVNSSFEVWRSDNPKEPYNSFPVAMEKMSAGGPLFDINKLNDISKNVLATMSAPMVCDLYLKWSEQYDIEMADLIKRDIPITEAIFNIDREVPNPRKDFAKWSEVKGYIGYFYDEIFEELTKEGLQFTQNISKVDTDSILHSYATVYDPSDDKDTWFNKIKDLSANLGYAKNAKTFKKDPGQYKGVVGDVAMVIRIALTTKSNTPDLYDIMQTLGQKRVLDRLQKATS